MQPNLKLFIGGFQLFENRIIETTVKLSKKRSPSLTMVDEGDFEEADVVIIDCLDAEAMLWAKEHQSELFDMLVIWVDGNSVSNGPKHVRMNRPILWVNLPITLTRIIDELCLEEEGESSSLIDARVKRRAPAPTGPEVLVVDDSKAVRDYLSKILLKSGYRVSTAESGDEAIEIVEKKPYSCILMDVLMPGIDGYKACREVRRMKHHPETPSVVMLTSKTSPFDKIRGKMAGCDAYLTKPVRIQLLLDTVEKYSGA